MSNQSVKEVQGKILEVMKFIDRVCRDNCIEYFIMGGTALGAVRHGGFIPWDDDLDIFMTPSEYSKFKVAFENERSDLFVLQEWRTAPQLEYAKVRMKGTTFIEEAFQNRKDLHQGIYVDIMMLHKVPENNKLIQKLVFKESKFVTLYALSQRGWKPKTTGQRYVMSLLKVLPCKLLSKVFYNRIYKYDNLTSGFKFCYWITPAKFDQGLFNKDYFENPVDIPFEDTLLLGSSHIKEYLAFRYGDYMKLPSEAAQKAAVHAYIFDTEKDYTEYIK